MSNELIYAMSTLGEIKLEDFYALLNSITIAEIREEESLGMDFRQHIIRLLDSLGYCEFDFEKRKVFMCPPSLVRLPSPGLPKAVLVGARNPSLINNLKSAVRMEYGNAIFYNIPQRRFAIDIPALICIEADKIETLQKISESCRINSDLKTPASWKLANTSEELRVMKNSLNYTARNWSSQPLKVFDIDRLKFIPASEEKEDSLTDFLSPITKQHVHWLWSKSGAAEVGKDWGRYIALEIAKRRVIIFDENSLQLAIPSWVPLPTLLARALTMSTGLPPDNVRTGNQAIADIPSNYPMQVYSGVEHSLAHLIASKLNQDIFYRDLSTNSGGIIN
ncbi:MAG: hypothetical protein M0T81_01970 [Thermoplasmatales archaeon]|nr:hypothetical protein [Thermoplasmatales archaeon]